MQKLNYYSPSDTLARHRKELFELALNNFAYLKQEYLEERIMETEVIASIKRHLGILESYSDIPYSREAKPIE